MTGDFSKMLPTGIIVLWFGSIGSIPEGWTLCDGTAGTPDLRNNFVVGAGDTFAVDDTGGSSNHDHNFIGDGHTHNLIPGFEIFGALGISDVTDSTAVTGTTDAELNLPPFHSLAFIMKL